MFFWKKVLFEKKNYFFIVFFLTQLFFSIASLIPTQNPPGVTHILPPKGGVATLAVNVSHGMEPGEEDPLLGRPAPNIHTANKGKN